MLIVGYCFGIRSERRLCEEVHLIALRAITRLTGISRTTLLKLLVDAGRAFSEYQDKTLVNLSCKRVQVDEAWAFC